MTISYTQDVASCTGLGVFWKLLFRWRGSIYKLVWQNLVVYCVLYFSLSALYRLCLNEKQQEIFEHIALYCQRFSDLIPVTFVLGFYVSIVITRWWGQYKTIPWPDSCCLFISTCLHGLDERGRLMRRTIARYLIVALVQTLRMTSVQVKKRFPTLGHLTEAGIITENEQKIIDALDEKCIQHPKYWMSLVWAGAILTRAKKEGRIKDDFAFNSMIQEISKFRAGCGGLLDYDWISVPLVYTQVVTLAVYIFFMSSLMGRQFLNPEKNLPGNDVDLIVPVFTFLQFFFYMGWLKVAEVFINPFGEDDDDFEMNWLIDRDIQVAYLIVDEMHAEHPELVKDQYWDEGVPDELPYTVASEQFRSEPFIGSTVDVEVSPEEQELVFLDRISEDEEEGQNESDLELNQIRIGENTNSKPVTIHKRTKRDSTRTSDGTIRGSIPSTVQAGSNNGSNRSMLGMLSKMLTRSSTTINKMGSMYSVASKATKGGRRRRKRNMSRNFSRASNLASENSPPRLSRVPTKDNEVFKMSNSSIDSFHTESGVGHPSDFHSRSNSDAHNLRVVRDLLKQDLNKYNGSIATDVGVDSRESVVVPDSTSKYKRRDQSLPYAAGPFMDRKNPGSYSRSKSDSKLLKKQLEKVQGMQKEIMKDLEAEITFERDEIDAQTFSRRSSDVMNTLELKTLELRHAIDEKRKRRGLVDSPPNSPTDQYSNALSSPFGQSPPVSFMARPSSYHQPPGPVYGASNQPSGPVHAVPPSQQPPDKLKLADPSSVSCTAPASPLPSIVSTPSHLNPGSYMGSSTPATHPYSALSTTPAHHYPSSSAPHQYPETGSGAAYLETGSTALYSHLVPSPSTPSDFTSLHSPSLQPLGGIQILRSTSCNDSGQNLLISPGKSQDMIFSLDHNIPKSPIDKERLSRDLEGDRDEWEIKEQSNQETSRSHEVGEDEPDYKPDFKQDFKPDPDEWEWDQSNLGTIQELPELGYQSDSSDTESLIPKLRKKSPTSEDNNGEESLYPGLPPVPEDKPL